MLLTEHCLFVLREIHKAYCENIKMFGGIFMNLKILGVIITIGGAVLSLADQNLKDKKMEEMIKKEVDKQINKK